MLPCAIQTRGKTKSFTVTLPHLSITYDLPTITPTATDDYKLVIITAKEFSSALQPLVDFKISKGVTTKLVTLK